MNAETLIERIERIEEILGIKYEKVGNTEWVHFNNGALSKEVKEKNGMA